MVVYGTVRFSSLFNIPILPVKHVSMEFTDTKTHQTHVFEHPPSKTMNKDKENIENRVIVGSTKYSIDELKKMTPKYPVYIPLIKDCRTYTIDMLEISELPNYINIKKHIRRANYRS